MNWYWWLIFAVCAASALWDTRALVVNAWRGLPDGAGKAIPWVAFWWTAAIAVLFCAQR